MVMTRSFVDKTEAVAAMKAAGNDLVYAVRNISDPTAPAIGEWSTGDVAAHLIDVFEAGSEIVAGKGTPFTGPDGTATNNDARLNARAERDPKVLADLLDKALTEYGATLDGIDGDPFVPWADFEVPVSTAVCVELAEALVHGYDVTKAEDKPWNLDPQRIGIAMKGLGPVTEHYVDPQTAAGFTGTFDLRLRGQWAQHFVFTDGELSVQDPADRKVDVHISADPVAFTLVGYGRIPQWGPMAKGQLLAWGRKPWLAMKFSKLLRNP